MGAGESDLMQQDLSKFTDGELVPVILTPGRTGKFLLRSMNRPQLRPSNAIVGLLGHLDV